MPHPASRRDEIVDIIHGVDVADPYRSLEDGDSPETRAWTEAQNAYTRSLLDARPGRIELHTRLTRLLQAGSSTSPKVAGNSVFSLDRWGEHDQAVLVVRPIGPGGETPAPSEPTIVVGPQQLGDDETTAIDWFHPSPDGRLVAYGTSSGGDERSTLQVIEVASGRHLDDRIPNTRAASVAWLPDSSAFAYTRYPDGDQYGRHVRWHDLGTPAADDPVVFDDVPERTAWPDVSISKDGKWLLVHVALGWSRVDVHLIERSTGTVTTLIEGDESVNSFAFAGDQLIGRTTTDAGRGRIVATSISTPAREHWTTIVAESESVIEDFAVSPSKLLVHSTFRAVARLHQYDLDGGAAKEIELPGLGAIGGLAASDEHDLAVFSFTSFTRPPTLFRWSHGATTPVPWSALPGAPDPDRYAIEQVRYPSTDGTNVSMFLIRPRPMDGVDGVDGATLAPDPTHLVLTGYGGFALTMTPAYSPLAVSVCDDGGVYAVACLRGGSEEGEAWHRAGMREHKQQVFDDFCSAADWLVDQGLTTREQLAIRGGSNGGLLVGAALTQRPDLCQAVVCAVPLLDMVRFPRFLIARLWIAEYGDPDLADEFRWLYAYSPYHRVIDGTCYPSVLFTTAEEDSRVDPCHARKMAARLQEATACADERPVLARIETRAGHGQGKPVSKQADEFADVLAFINWQLGVTP